MNERPPFQRCPAFSAGSILGNFLVLVGSLLWTPTSKLKPLSDVPGLSKEGLMSLETCKGAADVLKVTEHLLNIYYGI